MLIGFQCKNHPQQIRSRGVDRGDILPSMGELFQASPDYATDSVDDRALPEGVFREWNKRFNFTVDAAASNHNSKCERFFSIENSGLINSWAGQRIYCNPPFSDIRPWVEKAWAEKDTPLIVMLLPANRTEQLWWQELVEPMRDKPNSPLRVEFLPGRLKFLSPGEDEIRSNNRPPFGCCLLIWNREQQLK